MWFTLWGMNVTDIIERGGGVLKLSKAIGRHHSAVIGWRKAGRIPVEMVPQVSQATGVPPAVIRPDIAAIFFPPRKRRP